MEEKKKETPVYFRILIKTFIDEVAREVPTSNLNEYMYTLKNLDGTRGETLYPHIINNDLEDFFMEANILTPRLYEIHNKIFKYRAAVVDYKRDRDFRTLGNIKNMLRELDFKGITSDEFLFWCYFTIAYAYNIRNANNPEYEMVRDKVKRDIKNAMTGADGVSKLRRQRKQISKSMGVGSVLDTKISVGEPSSLNERMAIKLRRSDENLDMGEIQGGKSRQRKKSRSRSKSKSRGKRRRSKSKNKK
jgi:hypothetical protein